MAFTMKGINSLMNNLDKQVKQSSSPLFNTNSDPNSDTNSDLANLDYKDTEFVAEGSIPVKGEAIIPGQEVEKQLIPEDFEGGENNPEYQKKLAALTIAMEQGKDDKYQDQRVVRERDYTEGLIEKYGRFYKEDAQGIKHVATPTESGEYVTKYEAEKLFGGKNTPGYKKWWATTPMSKPGFYGPGKGRDYDPVFTDDSNLTDYTYSKVDD